MMSRRTRTWCRERIVDGFPAGSGVNGLDKGNMHFLIGF